MRKIILLCAAFFTMALPMSASPVRAQSVLWVGPNGSDGNACSQTLPCATFQGAINKGSVSQINCLGSGLYGVVTIAASLTIDCGTGNIGNVVTSGSGNAAITINTNAAATIILRHLSLNGLGTASLGINATLASGTLFVENCVIQGFGAEAGIAFTTTADRGLLQVEDTQIANNSVGIGIIGQASLIESVTLNRVEIVGNSNFGINLGGFSISTTGVVVGTIRKSVVGANKNVGVLAQSGQVFFTIEESSIVDNLGDGIKTNTADAIINVGASTIGGNGTGVLASFGSIISFGNNQMSANGSNGTFTSTASLQ